jgi:hypothetical protein
MPLVLENANSTEVRTESILIKVNLFLNKQGLIISARNLYLSMDMLRGFVLSEVVPATEIF